MPGEGLREIKIRGLEDVIKTLKAHGAKLSLCENIDLFAERFFNRLFYIGY